MATRIAPLRLRPFRQRVSYCGPACIKIVADFFGREFDERFIGKKCGTTVASGTSHEGMVAGATALGAKSRAALRGSIADLRHAVRDLRQPVIVAWYSPGRPRFKRFVAGKDYPYGHFSVVYHVSRTHIYLMDPDFAGVRRRMTHQRFERLWWDTDSKRKICVRRWYMTLRF